MRNTRFLPERCPVAWPIARIAALIVATGSAACAARVPDLPEVIERPAPRTRPNAPSSESGTAMVPAAIADLVNRDRIVQTYNSVFPGEKADAVPPAAYNSVLRYIDSFTSGRGREAVSKWLSRGGRYGPLIRKELRAAHVPESMFYLAMVESGLTTSAVSSARATGMWQFMPATARGAGLRLDAWVDERLDPVAATRAAAAHLRDLNRELGSWALAAAAYNAGSGRIQRAATSAGNRDYFSLADAGVLPEETANYIPQILALKIVDDARDRFGLGRIAEAEPMVFDTIRVEPLTLLSAVAVAADVPVDTLKALNPQLLRYAAPPDGDFAVRLPLGTDVHMTHRGLERMSDAQRFHPRMLLVDATYTARKGEKPATIAHDFGMSMTELQRLNPGLGSKALTSERTLRVIRREVIRVAGEPVGSGAEDDAPPGRSGRADVRKPQSEEPSRPYAELTPEPERVPEVGESDRAPDLLARLRGLTGESPRTVTAPSPNTVATRPRPVDYEGIHVVEPGETMSSIAVARHTTVRALVDLNGWNAPRLLITGERIRVAAARSAEPRNGVGRRIAGRSHLVRKGETLSKIAARYHVTTRDLLDWNDLGSASDLKAGMTLRLSRPE